ncbi:MAG TPA: RNA methyltransferase [Syntrophorhabdaceae bacterium]|jgi:23S rRNA (guanosine2251-2'-O)-methyltransferase
MPLLTEKKAILLALTERPRTVRKLTIEKGYERLSEEIIKEAKKEGISFKVLPKEVFSKQMRGEKCHVCLETDEFSYTDQDLFIKELGSVANPLLCAFDGIYDPQNLGNILRTSACFEGNGLIMPKENSCGVTEAAARVASGALSFAKIVRVTNLARYLEEIKKTGIFCWGLDEGGSVPIWDADLTGSVCLVFGRESGLRRLTREKCDGILRIPTAGKFSSLNLATSVAASFYEVRRQRARASR